MSRTPVREALSVLEQEGFVRSVPRRGLIVVRKSKREVVEMITVWAAIESMAARLAAPRVTAAELAELHALVDVFQEDPSEQISEYSRANMEFHKAIIRMGGVELMTEPDRQPVHPHARGPRGDDDAGQPGAALDRRSPQHHRGTGTARRGLAERLVREHTMGLAAHVEQHGDFLDRMAGSDDERRRQYA